MSTNENFKYDVRVRDRLVSKGLLTPEAVKAYLDGLKDMESEARPIGVAQPALSADLDDDDLDDEDEET
jgi:hypothetical protein